MDGDHGDILHRHGQVREYAAWLSRALADLRLALLLLFASAPAFAQDRALPPDSLSAVQRTEYQKLLRGYIDAFRILGWSTRCPMKFDADPHFRELAYRHGEKSEPMTIARLAYTSGTDHVLLDRTLDPKPPAPMPCDVMVHMKGMGLPPLPASLVLSPK
jgi:hypothetical protein